MQNSNTKNFKVTSNLAWCLVVLGGIIECFWVSGLKYSSNFLEYILTGFGIAMSFCCAMVAMKKLEVSVCYAVFVGIGTAGVVVAEMAIFNEPFSALKVALIGILLVGVIGLKVVSNSKDEEVIASEFRQDMGIDSYKNTNNIESKLENSQDSNNKDSIESNLQNNIDSKNFIESKIESKGKDSKDSQNKAILDSKKEKK
ncbi:QacE family quaternary ammonium compound efflux SMR transporter [Helicobacter saguini]|uniref:Multidrug efflux SMR transporter n=1 Tax=Helicobacter saguini TaxID=1548018 RepID=A0A347VS00_9HELI|nr:multidrug efflux SMR transporter [Helicobacter saguini]MWV62710.1 QacE family quaternary ammonium compound efflux SMR transporter [Helicobacter saguini]MWV66619.1 QacE family quaternary ammonium compound efflux SMR transporter [Helicobacter saguini]MWV68969.1 QacE family quaternary ammonium compound efflux SMR transporter [Helicobacter saguini]MWV71478.1 QacE family quaternary ammonium compound efflux SMR transporter [Helicobacter saguini]TLD94120.1 multidrug efflux SMR transporter [Helicob